MWVSIIPRGEHHDGQWMVDHYVRVAQKAAQYHVMLDAHEPVGQPVCNAPIQTGWPAKPGGVMNTILFSSGNNPGHETIMPFTRLMGGPMDYTPGIFNINGYTQCSGQASAYYTGQTTGFICYHVQSVTNGCRYA